MNKILKNIFIGLIAIVGIFLFGFFTVKGVENKAISLEEVIENKDGDIRAEEKRRFDLIPNLADCVKEYDEHEYRTLMGIVEARNSGLNVNGEGIRTMLEAVAEAYPDLKSQKNYQDLMNELSNTENRIVEHRKAYNAVVTDYKRYVRQFPSKQVLRLVGYDVKDYERLEFENTSVDAPTDLFHKDEDR